MSGETRGVVKLATGAAPSGYDTSITPMSSTVPPTLNPVAIAKTTGITLQEATKKAMKAQGLKPRKSAPPRPKGMPAPDEETTISPSSGSPADEDAEIAALGASFGVDLSDGFDPAEQERIAALVAEADAVAKAERDAEEAHVRRMLSAPTPPAGAVNLPFLEPARPTRSSLAGGEVMQELLRLQADNARLETENHRLRQAGKSAGDTYLQQRSRVSFETTDGVFMVPMVSCIRGGQGLTLILPDDGTGCLFIPRVGTELTLVYGTERNAVFFPGTYAAIPELQVVILPFILAPKDTP